MKKDRRGITRADIALVLSLAGVVSLVIHGLNFYFTWYVPPRAELSILVKTFSHLSSQDTIRVDVSGLVVNEGARSTTIKEVEFRYYFRNVKKPMPYNLEIIFKYSGVVTRLEKNFLAEGESSSFTFREYLPLSMLGEWKPEDFKEFTIIILHDDGIGLISNTKTIPVKEEGLTLIDNQ